MAAGLNLERIEVKVNMGSKTSTGVADEAGEVTRHVKKTRIGGRPRRRKSTLTPDELERLMYSN